jgi:hypothetical protein
MDLKECNSDPYIFNVITLMESSSKLRILKTLSPASSDSIRKPPVMIVYAKKNLHRHTPYSKGKQCLDDIVGYHRVLAMAAQLLQTAPTTNKNLRTPSHCGKYNVSNLLLESPGHY